MEKIIHVSMLGDDSANGTENKPLRTINRAAMLAQTGDAVIVHEGTYREWVKPVYSGYSKINRITYKAAQGEKVTIKGSEIVNNWENIEGTVWKAMIPNTIFGSFNPYKEQLYGDWLENPVDGSGHLGEVYLNGKSFYEAKSLEEVKNPTMRKHGEKPSWKNSMEKLLYPDESIFQWFSEVRAKNTIIYANFHSYNPNNELVEINVRQSCFYPEKPGLNYITVQGFEMAHAATPWTPPTADQPGLIGAHWSKGWIIEDNIIHDSKCSAISIGRDGTIGNNLYTRTKRKSGYQYQVETVFKGLQRGWDKEKIGSHIIRNNKIYDCGQNAIVGHMGCICSEIYNNHIYNIGVKHEFFGHEIAGIKLHAAIDVRIHNNRINNCTLGIWLDWQAQGVRFNNNILYKNDRDLMIEVSHGPHLFDNNIFGSEYNFDNVAQGTAFVHNLCCGSMRRTKDMNRSTPYHYPHTTQIAGSAVIFSGDDRIYNNIFIGGRENLEDDSFNGTAGYDAFNITYQDYIDEVIKMQKGIIEWGSTIEQPVYIDCNAYLKGAEVFRAEQTFYKNTTSNPNLEIIEEKESVYLKINVTKEMLELDTEIQSTETLGTVRIVDAIYDDPDGNLIKFDKDLLGNQRIKVPTVGPIEDLKEGFNCLKIWN